MKPILVMMAVLVGAQAAQADSTSLITNIQGRRTTSLNGKWQVIVDPYETGYYDYRHQPRTNGYFKNDKPRSKTDLIEYDFEASDRLQVPGDWNSQDPKLFLYEGTLWYKRDFDYHKRPQTCVFVYFGAANYDAIVFVNGERVGEHQGGFTPFNFEITDRVREGANFIVVKVDNQRLREGIPALDSDWWNYGGLTRDVVLVEEPSTFIQDYFIQLEKGSTNHIAGWVRLNGANPKQRVTIRIPEAHLSETYTANENGVAEFAFDSAGLSLWSPEAPKLYDVEVSAESDIVKDRIGFRTLETRGGDILLNGNPIFLRGICIHEEAPYRSGRAFSSDDARTLLGWARELGCNFVRLAHYPHNENMVRMADEMGILVWSEVPVYWVIAWDSPAALACARSQLAENITRDKTARPSCYGPWGTRPRSTPPGWFFSRLWPRTLGVWTPLGW